MLYTFLNSTFSTLQPHCEHLWSRNLCQSRRNLFCRKQTRNGEWEILSVKLVKNVYFSVKNVYTFLISCANEEIRFWFECFRAQHEGAKRIPYRQSPLTMVMKEFIEPTDSRTVMLVACSPFLYNSKVPKTFW